MSLTLAARLLFTGLAVLVFGGGTIILAVVLLAPPPDPTIRSVFLALNVVAILYAWRSILRGRFMS